MSPEELECPRCGECVSRQASDIDDVMLTMLWRCVCDDEYGCGLEFTVEANIRIDWKTLEEK